MVHLLGQNNETAPEVRKARFGMMILVMEDGSHVLSTDLDTPVEVERVPAPDEALGSVYAVLSNLRSQQAAAHTMSGMMNMTAMAAQAQQNQGLLGKLDLRK